MNTKNKVLSNVIYVLSQTWKLEQRILFIIFFQVIIGVVVPLITIYLPTAALSGILGFLGVNQLFFRIIILVLALIACNIINAYMDATYETYLLNNKIHFLTALFRKRMELDYSFIESGEGENLYQHVMATLLNEDQGISGMLRMLGALFSRICNIVLYIGIIALLEFELMAILLISSVIHFAIMSKTLERQYNQKDAWTDIDKKKDYLMNIIRHESSIKDIKIFSMQNWLSRMANTLIIDRIFWVKKIAQYDFFMAMIDIKLLIVRDVFSYFFIFQAILSQRIEIYDFVFFFGAITTFSIFTTELTNALAQISQKSREVDDIRCYLERDVPNHEEQKIISSVLQNVHLCVELINVSFRYSNETPYILENLNLKIFKGEKIALVGENGAGKTTLVKLICGLYKPTKGKILINGLDISEQSQTYIGSLFAAVFQDIHILPLSAVDNIAFDSEYKDIEIEDCIQIAGLDDIFSDIHTPVTKSFHKEGVVLSGGQEQKLVLARAFYKMRYQNASILVLDEPTAALDPLAELQLYENYSTLVQNKTSLFISHRLSSTQFCDRIVMLDAGKIIEMGSHQELMKMKGKYKEMYEIQGKQYKNTIK